MQDRQRPDPGIGIAPTQPQLIWEWEWAQEGWSRSVLTSGSSAVSQQCMLVQLNGWQLQTHTQRNRQKIQQTDTVLTDKLERWTCRQTVTGRQGIPTYL